MVQSVLGTDWFGNYISFKKNPNRFIDKRKLSKDAFCMDILKNLYSDEIPTQCKFHLLLALQEESSWLIQDEAILEQIVGSLKNLYLTIQNIDEKKLLKSQIFITITTVLLSWSHLSRNVCSIIIDIQCLMLKIALKESLDHVLRNTVCQCLEEIETFYPGILKNDLEVLVMACQKQSLSPVQSYVVLLSKCIKHKINLLVTSNSAVLSEEQKLIIQEKDQNSYSNSNNDVQIHHTVSCILELLASMNETSSFLVFQNLVQVVENTPEILPTVFKPFLMKLVLSSDVLYFHLAFTLLKCFGLQLFSTQEEKLLLRQLIMCINNPSLTTSHRLLFMNWLEACITQKSVVAVELHSSDLHALLPGPFDGPYTQEKKICVLATYFESQFKNGSYSDFLLLAIVGLKNQTVLSSSLKPVTSFFRSLFVLFSTLKDPKLHVDIQKLIMNILLCIPHLSLYILDFLKCVKYELNDHYFCDSTLGVLTEHITNLPTKQLASNIQSLLPILEVGAEEAVNICKPQIILRQLKKMLSEHNFICENSFVLGHCILSLCCVLLKFHDIENIYHELGELLHLVMKRMDDIDVQGRAKQIYAIVTSLPKTVVKGLLRSQNHERNLNHSLTFATGKDSLSSRNTTVKLSHPIISLERSQAKQFQRIEISPDANALFLKKGLSAYHEIISSENFQPTVILSLSLQLLQDFEEKFPCLFGVSITVQSSPPCTILSDIQVPVLKSTSDNEGTTVCVSFVPKATHPHVMHLNAQFTSIEGISYSFNLPSLILNFEDLFLSIPAPKEDKEEKIFTKKDLFSDLWKEDGIMKFSSSCCLKDIKQDIHSFVNDQWEAFVMDYAPDCPEYCIGIFLPPLSHLLMKLSLVNGVMFAKVLTDNSAILSWLSLYMNKLCHTYQT